MAEVNFPNDCWFTVIKKLIKKAYLITNSDLYNMSEKELFNQVDYMITRNASGKFGENFQIGDQGYDDLINEALEFFSIKVSIYCKDDGFFKEIGATENPDVCFTEYIILYTGVVTSGHYELISMEAFSLYLRDNSIRDLIVLSNFHCKISLYEAVYAYNTIFDDYLNVIEQTDVFY